MTVEMADGRLVIFLLCGGLTVMPKPEEKAKRIRKEREKPLISENDL